MRDAHLTLCACALLAAPAAARPLNTASATAPLAPPAPAYVESRGQGPGEVRHRARIGGFNVWITGAGVAHGAFASERPAHDGRPGARPGGPEHEGRRRERVARMRFAGGRAPDAARAGGLRPICPSYSLSVDPARWAGRGPLYDEAGLGNAHDGVDARSPVTDGTTFRVSGRLYQTYTGGTWQDRAFAIYVYDDRGLLAEITEEGGNSASRSVYSYDEASLLTELRSFVRNSSTGGQWVAAGVTQYRYGASGLLQEWRSDWMGGDSWDTFAYRRLFEYNASGRLDRDVTERKEPSSGEWMPTGRTTYSYNPDGTLAETLTTGDPFGSNPDYPSQRDRYFYEAGTRSRAEIDTWNPGDSAWQLWRQTRYSYDTDGNNTEASTYSYSSASGLFTPLYRYLYTYETAPVASERGPDPSSTLTLSVYPNPGRGEVRVAFELDQPEAVRLEILDLVGRRVAEASPAMLAAGPHTLRLALGRLPAGAYVVRLQTSGSVASQRVVVVD